MMSKNNIEINKGVEMSEESKFVKEIENLIGWGGRADKERIVEVLGDDFVTPVEGLTITRYELGVLLLHYWEATEILSVMNLIEKFKPLDRNLICLNNHAILRLMEIDDLLGPVECSDMLEVAQSKRDQIHEEFLNHESDYDKLETSGGKLTIREEHHSKDRLCGKCARSKEDNPLDAEVKSVTEEKDQEEST